MTDDKTLDLILRNALEGLLKPEERETGHEGDVERVLMEDAAEARPVEDVHPRIVPNRSYTRRRAVSSAGRAGDS